MAIRAMLFFAIILLSRSLHTEGENCKYVQPEQNLSNFHCSVQPCLTLDDYAGQAENFTNGTTFVFLPGSHFLRNMVNLSDITDMSFIEGGNGDATIHCQTGIIFQLDKVTNFIIQGLTFLLNYTEKDVVVFKILDSINIFINHTVFQGSQEWHFSSQQALHICNSTVTIVSCLFDSNTGCNGGAVHLEESDITIIDTSFVNNEAKINCSGGAIFSEDCRLVITGCKFTGNSANTLASNYGGSIYLTSSYLDLQEGNIFTKNIAYSGGAVYSKHSIITSSSFVVHGNKAAGFGGALNLDRSNATLSGINATNNAANDSGGAMSIMSSSHVKVAFSTFSGNVARSGGAIHSLSALNSKSLSTLSISGSAHFLNNTAKRGGAIVLRSTNASLLGNAIRFENNSAISEGGGIMIMNSNAIITAVFIGNSAAQGGGICTVLHSELNLTSAKFTNNSASVCGGAMYIKQHMNAYLKRLTAVKNSGSAICILQGTVTFNGSTYFSDNQGSLGGGLVINSRNTVSFIGHTFFSRNRAYVGGAIYTFVGAVLTFSGLIQFKSNKAETNGGAICALGSNITFWTPHGILARIYFVNNTAKNGGAIYMGSVSTLLIMFPAGLTTSNNRADEYGGVIYNEDIATPLQCSFEEQRTELEVSRLPYCFLNVCIICSYDTIQSHNDSAQYGDYIFGGLFDRCQLQQTSLSSKHNLLYTWVERNIGVNKSSPITSLPYQLCFCNDNQYDCSGTESIKAQRGQTFSVSLVALDQLKNPVSTQVTARTSQTGRVKLNQSIQYLPKNCSMLSFAIYSQNVFVELILYPEGPCRDTGLAKAAINMTLLPCPPGFALFLEECFCEERLNDLNAECTIDDDIRIFRKETTMFWVNSSYSNNTYQGLILSRTCPVGYCKDGGQNISLDYPDTQCADNRAGILCGACAARYSLVLGSSKCKVCSNLYLALLLPFATAGVVLVVFISALRLTVAYGFVNSIVLYANIIQVNKNLFLPGHKANVLTVFIAWTNLDLGIETCFYDGMTAYAQVWLQLVFPVYIWILIGIIILTSRYSIAMSKLIGHDPIAVLATLLLMSYTKILNVFVDVYSYASLSYPNSYEYKVWFKDGNLQYLQSWHLLLTVIISFFLVFLLFPYTLLLLVGYKSYSLANVRLLRWMLRRFKPFLDSYYAPYKKNTRFWTGFLLLIRCALYLSFSFNQRTVSSLSLITIFTALILLGWSMKWVYEKLRVAVVEFSIYFNIVAMSVATLININSAPLMQALIGLVFFTAVCIIMHQFCVFYASKSSLWRKIRARNLKLFRKTAKSSSDVTTPAFPSHDGHNIVTKTTIELREPLIEN